MLGLKVYASSYASFLHWVPQPISLSLITGLCHPHNPDLAFVSIGLLGVAGSCSVFTIWVGGSSRWVFANPAPASSVITDTLWLFAAQGVSQQPLVAMRRSTHGLGFKL